MKRLLLSKKLKGFTLIELIVAMVISGIVVMMAFTCYRITYKQYLAHRKSSNEITQAFLLNTLFKRDALLAQSIIKQDNSVFSFRMNDSTNIAYIFNADNILRQLNQLTPDTFPVYRVSVTANFNRNIITDNGLVDNIIIRGFVRGEPICYSYYKEYGADVLMKQVVNKE